MSELQFEAHEKRVIEEAKDLRYKINKLDDFITHSIKFISLECQEKDLLQLQLKQMVNYYTTLCCRIGVFVMKRQENYA